MSPPRGDDRPGDFEEQEPVLALVPRDDPEDDCTEEVQPQVRPRAHVEHAELSRDERGQDRKRADDLDDLAHLVRKLVS
jgi:hypothetical protein